MKKNDDFYPPIGGWSKHLTKMKLLIVFCLVMSMQLSASVYSQNEHISIQMKNTSLIQIFEEIERVSDYTFVYRVKEVASLTGISIKASKETLVDILEKSLRETNLKYSIVDKTVVITTKTDKDIALKQQGVVVKGQVKDEKGNTLPGATVVILGTQIGVATDVNGKFTLKVPSAQGILLEISCMGMQTERVKLSDNKFINVVLKEDTKQLDEVVVTGIFTKAKESFTGAATFITKEEIKEFASRDILKTIGNIDPSFNIVMNDEFGSDPNRLPEINIRGTSSVPNKSDQELETLQDNERVNLNTPLFILDGFEISLERMMDLNQDEIESITILKDASATAIYGAQGANGVVVLTSIKPKAGKLRVNYSGSSNIEVPDLRSYNLLNAYDKLRVEELAGLYQSDDFNEQLRLTDSYHEKLKTITEGTNTYWLSKPVQVGVGQNHSLSLSGGDPAFRYSLNFSYKNTQGAMKGSNRDNFNGSVNLTYLLKNFRFTNVLALGFNSSQNTEYGTFSEYANLNPYWRLYDEDGVILEQLGLGDPMLSPVRNPLYNASLGGYDKKEYTDIRENFQVEWSVNESFKISGAIGYVRNLGTADLYTPPNHTSFIGITDPNLIGSYRYQNRNSSTLNGQITLNYAKVINQHSIFIGVNSRLRETNSVYYTIDVTGFAHDRMDFISMGSQYKGDSPSGAEGTTRSVGFTFNGNYSFNNCYFVDLSYRLDGASSFGENSRFAPFYSLGTGWNLNRTKFFTENLPVFSNFRLKYSYGATGSLQFSPYDAMTTYHYLIDSDRYDGHLATSIKKMGNPELEWQTTYQHNIGTDISMWKNRFSISANYYYKRTENMITNVSLPLSNGYTTYTENMGNVLNEGLELNVTLAVLRNHSSGLRWNVSGGIMNNKNKLLKLSDAMKAITEENLQNSINNKKTTPQYLYREGESMNALYVVPSLGIDPITGKEMFLNEQGEVTYDYPEYYRVPIGLTQPKINGRFSSNWTYKNLRLHIGFSFRLGAHLYNGTLAQKVETNDLTRNVDSRVLNDRWKNPGDQSKYKGLANTDPTRMSSRFVQKESTLNLNSLSLDYRIPEKWLKKHLNMRRANISYSTNDLLYISTVKRERGTGYPYALRHNISVSFGL